MLTLGRATLLGLCPIFHLEPIDAVELGETVGDENKSTRACLSGEQHVIGPDRSALTRERGSYPAGCTGILPIEIENDEVAKVQTQRLEADSVLWLRYRPK